MMLSLLTSYKKKIINELILNKLEIIFPDGEEADITEVNIESESMRLKQSICDEDKLQFGGCISSEFSITLFNTVDRTFNNSLIGKWIQVKLACPCLTMTTACSTAYNESNITRTANTATETAIDIVSIDTENDVIYCTRLGAGSGRTVTKTATVINHSVTNNLSNVTTSNTSASIANNASYSAVLSAASGYTLSSVTVTMGGADITSTAYSNGTITISTVTGDLIITANAVQTSPSVSYTNLANPESSEWLNDTRLSSTATAVKTGSVVTNWIQCQKDDVIRIKGLDLFGTTGAEYLAYYENGVGESHVNINTYASAFTKDANGVYSYTVLMTRADHMASWADKITKMRFSAIKTGDVIITKNEEIT